MADSNALLVTGASGYVGRRTVEELLKRGDAPLIATTRTPEKLADLAERGVDVRRADFGDPSGLKDAFAGAQRMLLVSTDAIGERGARLRHHEAAIKAAEAAGVEHIIYTSYVSARPTRDRSLAEEHYWSEQAVAASNMTWAILRNSLYADFLLSSLPGAIRSGQLFSAAGSGRTSYITRDDCALAAAAALASGDKERLIFTITGPAALSQEEIAQIASEISGKPVQYVSVTADQLKQGIVSAGMPEGMADLMTQIDLAIAEGYFTVCTSDFKNLTGSEPTSVRSFLTAHRAALGATQG